MIELGLAFRTYNQKMNKCNNINASVSAVKSGTRIKKIGATIKKLIVTITLDIRGR